MNYLDGEAWCALKGRHFLNLVYFEQFQQYYNAIEKKRTGLAKILFYYMVCVCDTNVIKKNVY